MHAITSVNSTTAQTKKHKKQSRRKLHSQIKGFSLNNSFSQRKTKDSQQGIHSHFNATEISHGHFYYFFRIYYYTLAHKGVGIKGHFPLCSKLFPTTFIHFIKEIKEDIIIGYSSSLENNLI